MAAATQIATLTRDVTVVQYDANRNAVEYLRAVAGSRVYVERSFNDGSVEIRVPGTLAYQRVYPGTILPA